MQIKLTQISRSLILLALTLVISTSANATDLSGKVTEVIDGKTISLKSLSHTIKVRLLAAVPPAQGQPYANVAQKHLSDLILGKYVVVRYTGIGEQGYLVGRILLEQADISAQMLRDGVAWYSPTEASELSEDDRELYRACEKAARSERRGLWQDPAPTAPWDFKKAEVSTPAVSAPASATPNQIAKVEPSGRGPLTSSDLFKGFASSRDGSGQPNVRRLSSTATPGSWINYQPADQHFSVLTPSNAVEISETGYDLAGNQMNFRYVLASQDELVFEVQSMEGPNNQYTDAMAVADGLKLFVQNVNKSIAARGGSLTLNYKEVRNLRQGDYSGKEYSLSVGDHQGTIRLLSKQVGGRRELLCLAVINQNKDAEAAKQFLTSFKVN